MLKDSVTTTSNVNPSRTPGLYVTVPGIPCLPWQVYNSILYISIDHAIVFPALPSEPSERTTRLLCFCPESLDGVIHMDEGNSAGYSTLLCTYIGTQCPTGCFGPRGLAGRTLQLDIALRPATHHLPPSNQARRDGDRARGRANKVPAPAAVAFLARNPSDTKKKERRRISHRQKCLPAYLLGLTCSVDVVQLGESVRAPCHLPLCCAYRDVVHQSSS